MYVLFAIKKLSVHSLSPAHTAGSGYHVLTDQGRSQLMEGLRNPGTELALQVSRLYSIYCGFSGRL